MKLCSLVFAAAFLSTSLGARADTFSFEVAGGTFSGSGSLTAVADSAIPGAFEITSISGSLAGDTIVGLLPCATYDPAHPCSGSGLTFGYDNLLYPVGQSAFFVNELDAAGIGIALTGGDADLSASGSHTDVLYFNGTPQDAPSNAVGFSVTATPEPSSFLLLGTGVVGVCGWVRKRFA